jgi:hypothetical protein
MSDESEYDIEEQHREWLLAALRAATLRAKAMAADLDTIGIALRGNLIGPETAVKWINDSGLMFLVGALPEAVGRIGHDE